MTFANSAHVCVKYVHTYTLFTRTGELFYLARLTQVEDSSLRLADGHNRVGFNLCCII